MPQTPGTGSTQLVVTAQEAGQQVFLGYSHGQLAQSDLLQLDSRQPKSAHMAEMHALIWATWWIYRVILSLQWHGEVHFVWDACAAGGKADGDYYSGDSLGSILRCLQQALQAKGML